MPKKGLIQLILAVCMGAFKASSLSLRLYALMTLVLLSIGIVHGVTLACKIYQQSFVPGCSHTSKGQLHGGEIAHPKERKKQPAVPPCSLSLYTPFNGHCVLFFYLSTAQHPHTLG
eukprot:622140-Pleurochrysis_carterae.AAC.2